MKKFQGESKVENRLRIERGIERRLRVWTEEKENKFTDFEIIETDGMYPCRTEYTSNSLVSRNYIKK